MKLLKEIVCSTEFKFFLEVILLCFTIALLVFFGVISDIIFDSNLSPIINIGFLIYIGYRAKSLRLDPAKGMRALLFITFVITPILILIAIPATHYYLYYFYRP